MGSNLQRKVVFMWSGLPDYAARSISEFIKSSNFKVHVIATRPQVPIEGMEKSLGQPVIWINGYDKKLSWQKLSLERPEIVFQGGWAHPAFNRLAGEARNSGAKTILMNDQNWIGGLRHSFFEPLRYKLFHRKKFDGTFVPGKSGRRFAQALGFGKDRIVEGLYGADAEIFTAGQSLGPREKRFIFVGQLIPRKNILLLVEAFISLAHEFPQWSLDIVGSGPLGEHIPKHPKISVQGFLQPAALARELQKSRCLVLPSHEEHWGLVVHEAALCGCALALSTAIGSADDLATPENSVLFASKDREALSSALRNIASWTEHKWQQTEQTSGALARKFGPRLFAKSAQTLIEQCSK
jgi:glycosyltransferase involved in cell wall biosynthesis